MKRWFGRPETPKIALDLDGSTVSGGGSCPTQYEGRTTDGRHVYIRYRGGWLSVAVADNPDNLYGDENKVFDRAVGPPLNGDITMDQVRDLTGITIDGVAPPSPEAASRQMSGPLGITTLDLSGRTSYFRYEARASMDGSREIVSNLARALNAPLFELAYVRESKTLSLQARSSAATLKGNGIIAVGFEGEPDERPRPATEYDALVAGLAERSVALVDVRHPNWGLGRDPYDRQLNYAREASDAPFEVRWATYFAIAASVESNDEAAIAVAKRVEMLADAAMPEAVNEMIPLRSPLASQEPTRVSYGGPFEGALMDWCADAPDRFVGVYGTEGARPRRWREGDPRPEDLV